MGKKSKFGITGRRVKKTPKYLTRVDQYIAASRQYNDLKLKHPNQEFPDLKFKLNCYEWRHFEDDSCVTK